MTESITNARTVQAASQPAAIVTGATDAWGVALLDLRAEPALAPEIFI